MTARRSAEDAAIIGLVAAAVATLGCARADVYAVTGAPHPDGAAGDGGTPPLTCSSAVLPPGDTSHTVQVGSVSRTYVLHVPTAYDGKKPVPLVVDFHGIGGSGSSELASSPYPAHLDPEGVIMAFPDGLKGPAGTGWNVGPCCVAGVDDVAFARALVAQIEGIACVELDRVYAVGVLTGGGMAHAVACHAADVFAAAAPAAFDLLAENVNDCIPQRPITVISFRGTADSRVPYQGGASSLVPGMPITFLGAQATFEAWAKIDGCAGAASAADANGCASYAGCQGAVEVTLCTKQGGQEDPGDPNIAWPVLKRHTL
jgi:polyhydroxybutyrate depolymerase